jgi:ATP-dependent Clp protease ATP-binding subunit ClpA
MSYEEMTVRIQRAIRDYFTLQLGRPELLNRIGDNIVVFDFIDERIGQLILDMMISNVVGRVRQEYGVGLELTVDARRSLSLACLSDDTLALGGRGIGSMLETTLINPLATELFLAPHDSGKVLKVDLEQLGPRWTAVLTPT